MHILNLEAGTYLGQTAGRLDDNLLFLASALVSGVDVDNAIRIWITNEGKI